LPASGALAHVDEWPMEKSVKKQQLEPIRGFGKGTAAAEAVRWGGPTAWEPQ
jgi:phage-related protein